MSGATFAPYREALDYDDAELNAAFPGRERLKGIRQLQFDIAQVFAKRVGPQHRDLQALLRHDPADAIVADPTIAAGFTIAEAGGPPNAIYNITCLGVSGRGNRTVRAGDAANEVGGWAGQDQKCSRARPSPVDADRARHCMG